MKKLKYLTFLIAFALLFIFGKRIIIYSVFSVKGITVTAFHECVDPYLCIDLEVTKNGELFFLTIKDIQLSHFVTNNTIKISQINGYSVVQYGCNINKNTVKNSKTNQYVPYKWKSNGISIGKTDILGKYIGYNYNNIFDYINVIDSILLKIESIPDNRYMYLSNNSLDEVYIKRINTKLNKTSLINSDTVFTFKNEHCNCK
ncbi:hypothetical protein [Lentimicrobium sp. S6]|uniref:hypothetical protein n=1 Tax=Lentimicrobium sp. S6 TaxID=2735872 RepID=UPI001554F62E|nr:hypothetical protein [Lentimicrobium sp. S6]NPD48142.1 hypothetical protein [Lentimicrobium sp. S6]